MASTLISKNKDVIQSYIITSARYDFNIDEKRIFYKLIELCQHQLEGQKIKEFEINKSLFGDCTIQLPISSFLPEDSKNHARIKKALIGLRNATVEIEDDEKWKVVGLIEKPELIKKGYVKFELVPEIFSAILDFTKGFRKFELETAMMFHSVYSMRLYELISNQTKPISYSIDTLKQIFKLENNYKFTKDFISRVIDTAKIELDKKSPYSFTYKKNTEGKKITSLTFYPFRTKNQDDYLEEKRVRKQLALGWNLDKNLVNYLKEKFGFETDEIKHNRDVFIEAEQKGNLFSKKGDIMNFLSARSRIASEKANPKGYIINAIKSELKNSKNLE